MTPSHSQLEKRLRTRHPSAIYVSVFYGENKTFFGLLADLSSTGFRLSTEQAIIVDKHYDLMIRNPFSEHSDELKAFSAQAMWSRQSDDGLYDSGFQFVDFEGETKALFTRISEDFEDIAQVMNEQV